MSLKMLNCFPLPAKEWVFEKYEQKQGTTRKKEKKQKNKSSNKKKHLDPDFPITTLTQKSAGQMFSFLKQ